MQFYYSLKNEVYLKFKKKEKEITVFLRQTFIQKCRWICSELRDCDVEMQMNKFYDYNLYDYGKASHTKQ